MYVELPPEDAQEGMCGILEKSMYGTRDAAQNWEYEHTNMLTEAKFAQGKHSPCVFFHAEREVRVVVHGDDFTVLGKSEQLDWFRGVISKRMEVKFRETGARKKRSRANSEQNCDEHRERIGVRGRPTTCGNHRHGDGDDGGQQRGGHAWS